MIVSWTTSAPVIARVMRNIKDVDADFMFDLPDWIAEAIGKLQTTYQLKLVCHKVRILFHKGELPCKMEGLAAVIYCGQRMMMGDPAGPIGGIKEEPGSAFFSVIRLPNGVNDIDETDINDWPFYLNTVESLSVMPVDVMNTYRVNYNKIETTVENGYLSVWAWEVPKDCNNFPMIPDNENYKTALYWYCRMMMVGAGYEDKVFTYETLEYRFEKYGQRAINEITYPTVDQARRNIMNLTSLIPQQYYWETMGAGGEEGPFNDDLS